MNEAANPGTTVAQGSAAAATQFAGEAHALFERHPLLDPVIDPSLA